jgi:alpha-L-fucosidase
VSLLGYEGDEFEWTKASSGIDILVPTIPFNKMPCDAAWVLKLTNLREKSAKFDNEVDRQ